MKDVIVIAIVLAFFAVCAGYVIWCERILASDAPDGVAQHAQNVGRAASTAGAADISSVRSTDSTGSEADDARIL